MSITKPRKILIVSTRAHRSLPDRGQIMRDYFNEAGYTCILHTESSLYFKFTTDADVKLLYDFCPDLVIHMFAVQEELEVFKQLAIPFVSLPANQPD